MASEPTHEVVGTGPVALIVRIGDSSALTLTPQSPSRRLSLESGTRYRITWGAAGQAHRKYGITVRHVAGSEPVVKWSGGGKTLSNGADAGTDEFVA